jgi:hypothetical protein
MPFVFAVDVAESAMLRPAILIDKRYLALRTLNPLANKQLASVSFERRFGAADLQRRLPDKAMWVIDDDRLARTARCQSEGETQNAPFHLGEYHRLAE